MSKLSLAQAHALPDGALIAARQGPAGGRSIVIRNRDGRHLEVVHGDTRCSPGVDPLPDEHVRLTHAVLNCRNLAHIQASFEQALGDTDNDASTTSRSWCPRWTP